MKHAMVLGGIALLLWAAAATGAVGAIRVVLLMSGLAFLLIAGGYAFAGPSVFMKTDRGTLHPLSFLLLWPYHVLAAAGLLMVRLSERHDPHVEVAPRLYLGRHLTAREAAALQIACVVDLACELPENGVMRRARYLSLPVLDATAPTAEQLRLAVGWIREALGHGPTYVHCAMGRSRSATVVIAYLLTEGIVQTVDEGVEHLRSLRPGVMLEPCQQRVLERFATIREPVTA